MGCWEHFPHGADIGVRGIGATVEEAFEQAAVALTAVVVTPEAVRPERSVDVDCAGGSLEDLFVDWLNALVFEMATRRMVFGAFRVRIEGGRLRGTATGETVEPGRHEPAVEIKGATYTALQVEPQADGRWVAQCVVDV